MIVGNYCNTLGGFQHFRTLTSPIVSSNDTQQPVSNDQWFEPEEEKSCNFAPVGLPETGVNRLRRSSSSYPDLKQVPPWETGDNQSRFYDDFGVNLYRPAAEYDGHRPLRREEPDVKVIPVDTFEIRSLDKPPINSSKPPQTNLKRRRSFHSVPRKKNEAQVLEVNEKQETSPPSLPPQPPLLPTELSPPVEKPQKLQRRRSGTKELATAIASLYNQSNRKRRTKKRDYSVANSPPSAEQVLPPATPLPPPPPPSKVFQNLFKKNRKSKRVHSDPSNVPSPPPPPPLPNSIFNNLFKSKRYFHYTASSTPPPPPPPPPPQAHVSSRRRRSPPHSQPPRQRLSSSRKPPLPRQHTMMIT
ncbi:hypothetical protein K7X08_030976 [Anisodus acutangulus]|uniref:Uncharacterized protein n=1 Tax=Anisodus acutangulus TaxID=402998 RepID=A0A9Q1RRI0_9SOLA|nr:hypothetical protein K7X08_030976 [Anisodus acutangulus]